MAKNGPNVSEEIPPIPAWYRVCLNTIVRKGEDLNTERMRILPMGSRVHAIEISEKKQSRRVKIDQPIQGWCSLKSSSGDTILSLINSNSGSNKVPNVAELDYTTQQMVRKNDQRNLPIQQRLTERQKNATIAKKQMEKNPEVMTLYQELGKIRRRLEEEQRKQEANSNLQEAEKNKAQKDLEELTKQSSVVDEEIKNMEGNYQQILEQYNKKIEEAEISNLNNIEEEISKINEELQDKQEEFEEILKRHKAFEKEIAELNMQVYKPSDKYQPGDCALLKGAEPEIVIIQYYGPIKGKGDKKYVGVKFEHAVGDTNGTYEGETYFVCAEKYGAFYDPDIMIKRRLTSAELLQKLSATTELLEANFNKVE